MPGTLQLVTVGKTPQRIQTFMVQNASFMLVNPDITNNIFIGNDPGSQIIAVPPLGSVTLTSDPNHDVWVSTNGGNYTVAAYLMPNGSNWVPSPAQVAAQINALGLAKDTTVGSVVTNTTGAAKDTTVNTVATNTTGVAKDTTVGTLAKETGGNLQSAATQLATGVAPLVPNYATAGGHGNNPGIFSILALGVACRLWSVSLTYGMYGNGTLASGQTGFAAIKTHTGGLFLNVVDNGLGEFAANTTSGESQSVVTQVITLNGYPISAAESLDLSVNGSVTLTNIIQRGSYCVYYSVP